MSDDATNPDDERGSEVDDYTGEVPRIEVPDDASALLGDGPTGFGDGDVADIDDDAAVEEGSAEAVEADSAELLAEVDRLRQLAMRQQADFENFRKRATNQQNLEVERATGKLANALLPVLDAAEAAYVQHPDEIGPLLNQLIGELKKVGLEPLDLADQPFDPELAEAVAHQPGNGGETIVAEVLRSGYTWQGKTLRPAMVRTTD
ncbi:molecular chaperone GrpE [Ilumatobacter fluminis]|uniref:Protein GrpE n=1 Tax=Ilumatobacter fluminis TaxID=467091 RepID=A0A4R7I542_9ACTN|nr:nucleotide exchange factor GrpE [Ilumatobacter fluminis]TDT18109.1 molecular chaperone GrpE [Ilumatobacter fluminis]